MLTIQNRRDILRQIRLRNAIWHSLVNHEKIGGEFAKEVKSLDPEDYLLVAGELVLIHLAPLRQYDVGGSRYNETHKAICERFAHICIDIDNILRDMHDGPIATLYQEMCINVLADAVVLRNMREARYVSTQIFAEYWTAAHSNFRQTFNKMRMKPMAESSHTEGDVINIQRLHKLEEDPEYLNKTDLDNKNEAAEFICEILAQQPSPKKEETMSFNPAEQAKPLAYTAQYQDYKMIQKQFQNALEFGRAYRKTVKTLKKANIVFNEAEFISFATAILLGRTELKFSTFPKYQVLAQSLFEAIKPLITAAQPEVAKEYKVDGVTEYNPLDEVLCKSIEEKELAERVMNALNNDGGQIKFPLNSNGEVICNRHIAALTVLYNRNEPLPDGHNSPEIYFAVNHLTGRVAGHAQSLRALDSWPINDAGQEFARRVQLMLSEPGYETPACHDELGQPLSWVNLSKLLVLYEYRIPFPMGLNTADIQTAVEKLYRDVINPQRTKKHGAVVSKAEVSPSVDQEAVTYGRAVSTTFMSKSPVGEDGTMVSKGMPKSPQLINILDCIEPAQGQESELLYKVRWFLNQPGVILGFNPLPRTDRFELISPDHLGKLAILRMRTLGFPENYRNPELLASIDQIIARVAIVINPSDQAADLRTQEEFFINVGMALMQAAWPGAPGKHITTNLVEMAKRVVSAKVGRAATRMDVLSYVCNDSYFPSLKAYLELVDAYCKSYKNHISFDEAYFLETLAQPVLPEHACIMPFNKPYYEARTIPSRPTGAVE